MDLLVTREGERVGAEERVALMDEWAAVRAVDVSDPAYVEHEVREWVSRQGLQRAMLAAADLYQRGAPSHEVRAYLLRSLREGDPLQKSLVPLVATYAERMAIWAAGEDRGVMIPTGFRSLDRALGGGVRIGETFVALAPPKGAKTTFQLNVALNALRQRYSAVLFSYEMGTTPMLFRADRNITHATRTELRENPLLMERIYRGLIAAGAGELWVGTGVSRNPVGEAYTRVGDLRREGHPVHLVVFDFLNIMTPSESGVRREERRPEELGHVMRDISSFAKDAEVVAWTAALVTREATARLRIRKTDIGHSYEPIAVADGVIGICAPEELLIQGKRSLYLTALRESGDEAMAGIYSVDLDRMVFLESREADAIPGSGAI